MKGVVVPPIETTGAEERSSTASVQVLASAVAGTRAVRLQTGGGEVMGPMTAITLTVTN